eukprot:g4719.t1
MEEFDDLLQAPDDSGYLDLSHRAWSSLDDVLWSWGQSLIVLNVSFNNLKTISPGIGELSLLRELDASCNHIEALPEEIGKCVRLKKLKINGNRMEILPKAIGNCKMLEELIASENALLELPSSVGNLGVLRLLRLSNNKLSQVPPEVGQCLALEEVDFTGNDLENLPEELRTNTQMTLWLCKREGKQRQIVDDLEHTTAELEDAARLQDEKQIQLQDQIRKLESDVATVKKEIPTTVINYARVREIRSKVCTVQ